jgi:hypothetical protein
VEVEEDGTLDPVVKWRSEVTFVIVVVSVVIEGDVGVVCAEGVESVT